MSRLDALRADAAVLARLVRGMPRSSCHAQDLSAFYGPQSDHYDRFRERLLRGREELIRSIPLPDRAHVVELGGGTGRNAEFFAGSLARIRIIDIVDLCVPLLDRARERARRIHQLRAIEADATTYRPAQPVDVVLVSYALTMIHDWRATIRNAIAMLKPGGILAVVDFHVLASPADAQAGESHGWFTRAFWPTWFAHDGVRLDPAHLHTLRALLPDHAIVQARAPVPYLPLLRVPYYRFLGRTPG